MSKSKNLNVQVPGETAPAANEPEIKQAEQVAAAATSTDSVLVRFDSGASEGAKPEVTDADVGGVAGQTPPAPEGDAGGIDVEAIRAQAKAEALAELQAEFEAAKAAMAKQTGGNAPAQITGRNYRHMRADDIDPRTLTAPVMTKDGYLCPVPPEAKK